MSTELRIPNSTRENRSRPLSSVPSQNVPFGPCNTASLWIWSGSCGANTLAIAADTTKTASTITTVAVTGDTEGNRRRNEGRSGWVSWARACSLKNGPLSPSQARIQIEIGDVNDDVDRNEHHGQQGDDHLNRRIVPVEHRIDEVAS